MNETLQPTVVGNAAAQGLGNASAVLETATGPTALPRYFADTGDTRPIPEALARFAPAVPVRAHRRLALLSRSRPALRREA